MNYRSMLEALRREEANRRLAVESLKVCPLCGAVNAHLSSECFVCRWSGEFSFDADEIEDGVLDMLIECPDLVDAFMPPEPPQPRTILDRMRTFFSRRRVKRRLDMLA